jgi:exoribonuclease R
MNTRPAWGVLFLGAMIVIALFFSPIWLEEFADYIREAEDVAPFPDAFYQLPLDAQDQYLDLYATNQQMAIDFVAARLAPETEIEEPNLPAIDANPQAVQEMLNGSFRTIDSTRSASGLVGIFRLSDGRYVVRLQDLNAINGPDLHVLLSAYHNPTTQEQLDQVPQYQIDLGPLKGSRGNQNYIIQEPTFNIDNYQEGSIVLYSTRYEIVFSYAMLEPTQNFPAP